MDSAARIGIVVVTRDRRGPLLGALARLTECAPGAPVMVVDNASSDGTAAAVRAAFPEVAVVEAPENLGAGARTLGAQRLGTPYVAFSDDDSWWDAGALRRAAEIFDAHPRLGLLAARVLVGADARLDPVCEAMARSPLTACDAGAAVLGFVACGAVVRRSAFLAAGGFDARYGIGGEERRLALDLAALGWELAYVPDVVARHHPDGAMPRPGRAAREVRNELWSAWLRRPARAALRRTGRVLRTEAARRPSAAAHGALQALAGARWVARERRVVPADVVRAARAVEAQDG
jgi:N-acetylglucosaminyl-diphospho-decaprenol L-rhamnosyltransferase